MTRIREPSLRKRRLHDLAFFDPVSVNPVRIFQLLPVLDLLRPSDDLSQPLALDGRRDKVAAHIRGSSQFAAKFSGICRVIAISQPGRQPTDHLCTAGIHPTDDLGMSRRPVLRNHQ